MESTDTFATFSIFCQDLELSMRDTFSVTYLKTLLPLTVVNIIKHRLDHDDDNYDYQILNNVPYVTISPKTKVGGDLHRLHFWLKNAMISVEKEYLQAMFLVIKRRSTNKLTEYYRFKIKYLPKDQQNVYKYRSNIFERTSNIFSQINCLEGKYDVEDVNLTLEIVFNESAPRDYNIPPFEYKHPFIKSYNIGFQNFSVINTPYSKLRNLGKRSLDGKITEVQFGKLEEQNEELNKETSPVKDRTSAIPEIKPRSSGEAAIPKLNFFIDYQNRESNNEGNPKDFMDPIEIDCMCSITYWFEDVPLIECQTCNKHNHVPCLGFKSYAAVPQPFSCFKCCIAKNKKYQDMVLSDYKSEQDYLLISETRLFLFCILYCGHTVDYIIEKIPNENLQNFLEKLTILNLVELNNKEYTVNTVSLELKCNTEYFYNENMNIPKPLEDVEAFDVLNKRQQYARKVKSKIENYFAKQEPTKVLELIKKRKSQEQESQNNKRPKKNITVPQLPGKNKKCPQKQKTKRRQQKVNRRNKRVKLQKKKNKRIGKKEKKNTQANAAVEPNEEAARVEVPNKRMTRQEYKKNQEEKQKNLI